MSSTKSCIGHLLGAAGAVEAIFSILAIRDRVAPPTINLDNPSVETPIDLVPHVARKREIDTALSNSFGFGGTNASLIFTRYSRIGGRAGPQAFAIILPTVRKLLVFSNCVAAGPSARVKPIERGARATGEGEVERR